ncbi:MAG: ATP-grasp domain-containing protein [Coriobacteriia bacterium]|nr:ATP-grasp domain-containing protein [Coriobacteriia bacterium]
MHTALVTSLGSTAGDIVIKKLKENGFCVVGASIYPEEWLADALMVDVFYESPRADHPDEFLPFLYDVCEKEAVDFVVPLIDPEVDLLNVNRTWFEEHGVTLGISPKPALDIIRDKKKLADFIRDNCPDTVSIPTEYLRDLPEMPNWGFPLVCKPCNGRSSQGLTYVNSQEEWNALVAVADMDTYIVEPFVKGPICMVEIVRNPAQGVVVTATREELMSTPHCLALTVRTYQDEALEQASAVLAEKLGIVGNVNFEYLRDDDGVYHFVECNPRFSAGAEFAVMAGFDVVTGHIRSFAGEDVDAYEFDHPRIIARKYEEFLTKEEK